MKPYKILIVEDDRQLAEMLKMSFDLKQFAAKICYDGLEALNEISRERPDMIILDVMLPGIDGWEVMARLKANTKTSGIPVIICTARDGLQDVEKSFSSGAQSYVAKPIDFDKLLKKVAVILNIETLLSE